MHAILIADFATLTHAFVVHNKIYIYNHLITKVTNNQKNFLTRQICTTPL